MFVFVTLFSFISWIDYPSSNQRIDQLHDQAYSLLDRQIDSALMLTNQALKISEEKNYNWGIANSLWIKGYILEEQQKPEQALLSYLKADYSLKKSSHDKALSTRINLHINIGSILRRHFKYDASVETYREGLLLADSNSFSKQRLQLLFNLGQVYQNQGNLPLAIQSLKEGLYIAKKRNDYQRTMKIWNLLGIIHKDNSDYVSSRNYYNAIISHPEARPKIKGQALHNLGMTFIMQQDFNEAIHYFLQALEIKKERPNPLHLFRTYFQLSEAYLSVGMIDQSIKVALLCDSLYSYLPIEPETYQIFRTLDTLNFIQKNYEVSQRYSSKFFQESNQFDERQKELIELKESFKTDLILSGFKNEMITKEREEEIIYHSIFGSISFALLIISFFKYKSYKTRRAIQREILKLKIVD